MSRIQLVGVQFHIVHMRTRFPFRYGIASMSEVPHLFLRAEMRIDGKEAVGISSEGLPPRWFTKNPEESIESELEGLLGSITRAAGFGVDAGEQHSLFALWHTLYQCQSRWGKESKTPPLLSQFGVSLIERSLIDGICRHHNTPFARALTGNLFGFEAGNIHPVLAGHPPSGFLPGQGSRKDTILTRHTIGLTDPLTRSEIPAEDRVDDGLPQALEDCISEYGLKYFKVKLSGNPAADRNRMKDIARLFTRKVPDYRITLDGNEQFKTISSFRDFLEQCLTDPTLREFLSSEHLLFVEQPLHRSEALADHVASDLDSWDDAPPLIIDESDAELHSAARALDLGYPGTSHKNCKGVFKSIANACLLELRRRTEPPGTRLILSGEDLVNVGPVALLQDLTVMHALGIRHVERNGHHFFRGLSAFPEELQAATLRDHADLYTLHPEGFPRLHIQQGQLNIESLLRAPFGTAFRIDELVPGREWLDPGETGLSHLLA